MGHSPKPIEVNQTTFGKLSRSELMSRIRSKGNKTTEQKLAKLLRKNGLHGWRRHKPLPGRPDFVWSKIKVAVFVDGCFWHGHDCGRNLKPKTNSAFWDKKIINNRKRDQKIVRILRGMGWSVIRIWECQLSKEPKFCITRIKRVLTRSNMMLAPRKVVTFRCSGKLRDKINRKVARS